MEHVADPYWKLKPAPPIPEGEYCTCDGSEDIYLCYLLRENPLRCAACSGYVRAETIGFLADVAEAVASWTQFYGCFYLLWLDSGDFEDWALAQMANPASSPNMRGYEVTRMLSTYRRCYFWWFQDVGRDGFEPLVVCPRCKAALTPHYNRLACQLCSIVVAN